MLREKENRHEERMMAMFSAIMQRMAVPMPPTYIQIHLQTVTIIHLSLMTHMYNETIDNINETIEQLRNIIEGGPLWHLLSLQQ